MNVDMYNVVRMFQKLGKNVLVCRFMYFSVSLYAKILIVITDQPQASLIPININDRDNLSI